MQHRYATISTNLRTEHGTDRVEVVQLYSAQAMLSKVPIVLPTYATTVVIASNVRGDRTAFSTDTIVFKNPASISVRKAYLGDIV